MDQGIVNALANIELFSGIHAEGLEKIAEVCVEQTYAPGETVFREGELGDKLFLIREGEIRISRKVSGMGEEALAMLGAGAAFGEMSIVDESPRSADAIVHERCRLLVLTKEAIEDLMFLEKDLAYEILWNFVRILAARLRETNDKMTFMSMTSRHDASARLGDVPAIKLGD